MNQGSSYTVSHSDEVLTAVHFRLNQQGKTKTYRSLTALRLENPDSREYLVKNAQYGGYHNSNDISWKS